MIFNAQLNVLDEDILLAGLEERGFDISVLDVGILNELGEEISLDDIDHESGDPGRAGAAVYIQFKLGNNSTEELSSAFDDIMELEGYGGSLEMLTDESGQALPKPKFVTEV